MARVNLPQLETQSRPARADQSLATFALRGQSFSVWTLQGGWRGPVQKRNRKGVPIRFLPQLWSELCMKVAAVVIAREAEQTISKR